MSAKSLWNLADVCCKPYFSCSNAEVTARCSSGFLQVSTIVVLDVALLLVVVEVLVLLLVLSEGNPLFCDLLRKHTIMGRQLFTEISNNTYGKFHEYKLENPDEQRTSRFCPIPLR